MGTYMRKPTAQEAAVVDPEVRERMKREIGSRLDLTCPECDVQLNHAIEPLNNSEITPGTMGMCQHCRTDLVFTGDSLRKATEEEAARIHPVLKKMVEKLAYLLDNNNEEHTVH